MPHFAHAERQALADLFLQVGPDAPTCCEGWATRDLAAHLIVRERRPDAAPGVVLPLLAGYTKKVSGRVASQPWSDLVMTVRNGPPFPLRLVDEEFNTVEYFVHHEDVRRAAEGWEPRTVDPALELALWKRIRSPFGRILGRSAPVGVELNAPGFGSTVLKSGPDQVTVTGPPGELVLFGFGRARVARVTYRGSDAAIGRLKGVNLGF